MPVKKYNIHRFKIQTKYFLSFWSVNQEGLSDQKSIAFYISKNEKIIWDFFHKPKTWSFIVSIFFFLNKQDAN